jgi:hypothetical protein
LWLDEKDFVCGNADERLVSSFAAFVSSRAFTLTQKEGFVSSRGFTIRERKRESKRGIQREIYIYI